MARAVWRLLQDLPCPPETRFRHKPMHGLARLRRGSGTNPCMECGKGVKNRFRLCLDCGYHKARMRAWQRDHRAFMVEFKRLAAIEIFI